MWLWQNLGMSEGVHLWQSDNSASFLMPPRNQKSRLLYDSTYHFNNTWEGEYLIKNYPAMLLWKKFGMSEGVHLW